jgi:hypothetical protein
MTRPRTNRHRPAPVPPVWEKFPFAAEGVIVGKGMPQMELNGRCKVVLPVAFGSAGDRYPVHLQGTRALDAVLTLRMHRRVRVEGYLVKPPLTPRQLRAERRDGMEIVDRPVYIEARTIEPV